MYLILEIGDTECLVQKQSESMYKNAQTFILKNSCNLWNSTLVVVED